MPKLVLRKAKTSLYKTLLACMQYYYCHLYSWWYSGCWDWHPFYIWQQSNLLSLLIAHFQTLCADQALLFARKEKQILVQFMVARANFTILSVPDVPAFSAMLLDTTGFSLVPFNLWDSRPVLLSLRICLHCRYCVSRRKIALSGFSVCAARLLRALRLFLVSPHCTKVCCVVVSRHWYFLVLWQSWLWKYSSYK